MLAASSTTNETMASSSFASRCTVCGRSKTVDGADFVHVRLGLDEPPEPLLCKCKSPIDMVHIMQNKFSDAASMVAGDSTKHMNTVPPPNVNAVIIESLSSVPLLEVELRFGPESSRRAFEKMTKGVFGHAERHEVEEEGCSWWTGLPANKIAKVRERSNGEKVVKVPIETYKVAPGVVLAMSYELPFTGRVVRSEYKSVMVELSCDTVMSNTKVRIIARRYGLQEVQDSVHTPSFTYACEVELLERTTHADLRRICADMVSVVGSVSAMSRFVDQDVMSAARRSDHAVVDVNDISAYSGKFMLKADGVKVYVFCYSFGYVVTDTHPSLRVVTFEFVDTGTPLYEMTSEPDILVAEMMVDGTVIFIATLHASGCSSPTRPDEELRPNTLVNRPPMLIRKMWKEPPSPRCTRTYTMPNDGLVCVTPFRTLRKKQPTVDLLYGKGMLSASSDSGTLRITSGSVNMIDGAVYELVVSRSPAEGYVRLTNPVERTSKTKPNNTDVVKRAFMSVLDNVDMNTVLFDVTSISFRVRSRVYDMCQSYASSRRSVIVMFGAGRFQEWYQMRLGNFSYIAVDPNIDTKQLERNRNVRSVVPYDMTKSMALQVSSMARRPGTLLYCKSTSEAFLSCPDVISTMSSVGIPGVFSFSISYHIGVINTLVSSGVHTFGCGYVHDGMSLEPIGTPPVTMSVHRSDDGKKVRVVSVFGKSTYAEPVLLERFVPNMKRISTALPDVWKDVDAATRPIMERCVIMYSS